MKTKLMLIITIFLCTWGVYATTTEKAPLVLQTTVTISERNIVDYYYLQKQKMEGDYSFYGHDIWYKSGNTGKVIMLSTLDPNSDDKKWVVVPSEYAMINKCPTILARYEHSSIKPPAFPTQENDLETWKMCKDEQNIHYEVKSFIPAISNIKSSEELKQHVDFITQNTKAGITKYVKTKLDEKADFFYIEIKSSEELKQHVQFITKFGLEFESLCSKYSTVNILLKVTIKKEEFDKELLEFKNAWYPTRKALPLLYQKEVDRITKTFNTRIYWRTGIIVVLIIIVICIVVCILFPKHVETTNDMTNDEIPDTYDEENPAPMSRISNSVSETVRPITPVIFCTVSSTVSSHNFASSEKRIDHLSSKETTSSFQLEEKLSNDIVTQQETDIKALPLSKEIVDADTNENTNPLHAEKQASNDIVTQQKTDTDIHDNPNSLKSADEKKVSYGIATQQGKDTKALLLSEEVDAEKKVSNDIVIKQETNTNIHENPKSLKSAEEQKVSNDIVTQQENDTNALLLLQLEDNVSNDIITQQEKDTDTNKTPSSLKSAEKISVKEISVKETNYEKLPTTKTITEEETQ